MLVLVLVAVMTVPPAELGGSQGSSPALSPFPVRATLSAPLGLGVQGAQLSSCNPTPCVANTLVTFNNTLVPGNFLASDGGEPMAASYDPAQGEIFVADYGTNVVSVVSDTTNKAEAAVSVGSGPDAIAYDNGKGEAFVANWNSGNVSVISNLTDKVVASVHVGSSPDGVAYDPVMGEVFVANFNSFNVSVISDATNKVVATVPVGAYPAGVAYDSGKGEVFVTNLGSNNVSVVSDTTNKVVATVKVGTNPWGVTYDSAKGEIFVTNSNCPSSPCGTGTVSVISDANDTVLATIGVGSSGPDAAVYDPGKGQVLVANTNRPSNGAFGSVSGMGDVSVISDASNTVITTLPLGTDPYGMAYDPGRGEVFVSNSTCPFLPCTAGSLWILSDSTDALAGTVLTGSTPSGIAYDSGKSEVFVPDYACSPSFCGQLVEAISDANDSVVATTRVGQDPVAVAYDSGKSEVFVVNEGSGNVSVISDTTGKVVAKVQVGQVPFDAVYDPTNGEVYVANEGSGNVSVISDALDRVVANISVGTGPEALAYDSAKGEIFVANSGSNNLTVISAATNKVSANINVGSFPDGITYDPKVSEVFVTNGQSGSVSVVSDTTDKVVAAVAVGPDPQATIAVDPANGLVFVANYLSNSVSVISDVLTSVVATLGVGAGPTSLAYDGQHDVVYVTNSEQGTLSIIDTGKAYPVTFNESGLPLGTNWSVTFNGALLSSVNSSITFYETNGTMPFTVDSVGGYVGSPPTPSSGNVTVTGGSVRVSIAFSWSYRCEFNESGLPHGVGWSFWLTLPNGVQYKYGHNMTLLLQNGTWPFTVNPIPGYTATPSGGTLVVNGTGATQRILFTPLAGTYAVTFSETGLPGGTSWSVNLNGTVNSSSTPTVGFSEANGTYLYNVTAPVGYTAQPLSGSLTVSGKAVSQSVNFVKSSAPARYSVTFFESGLTSGTVWSVSFNGTVQSSSISSIVFGNLLNRTAGYAFTVGAETGFTSTPSSGTVVVNGANVTRAIAFTKSPGPARYTVTFTETGLPRGTSWSVILNGTTNASITSLLTFNESNSTYAYTVGSAPGFTDNPSSGSITVNGGPAGASITFTAIPAGSYSVTFRETGLPTGANWSATLAGKSVSATGSTLSFTEKNGTYNYTVNAPTGYAASPSSGSLTVSGKAISQSLTFTKTQPPPVYGKYTVTFSENGLASGTSWSVTLNGSTQSSTATTITFSEANGSYSFTVGSVSGYAVSPPSGTVKVNGASTGQAVTFTSSSSGGKTNQSTGFLGLPGEDGYFVIGVIVAVVAIAAGVLLLRGRRNTPPRGGDGISERKKIENQSAADGASKEQAVE